MVMHDWLRRDISDDPRENVDQGGSQMLYVHVVLRPSVHSMNFYTQYIS